MMPQHMGAVQITSDSLKRDKEFYSLEQGDKILLTNGEEMEFVRHKQVKFLAMMNGGTYDVPNKMFVKLISKAVKDDNWYRKLKKGDAFYIVKGAKDCVAFHFEGIEAGKIIGIHPLTKARVRIDMTFDGGKL